jgi:hypothetical protein
LNANTHKYWVNFTVQVGNSAGQAQLQVARFMPMCGEADVIEVGQVILQRLRAEGKIPGIENALISIIGWTKFEEPGIIVARGSQAQN